MNSSPVRELSAMRRGSASISTSVNVGGGRPVAFRWHRLSGAGAGRAGWPWVAARRWPARERCRGPPGH